MAVPTLALIPAAQGSKLYSVLPSNGVGDFDFTRASTATRINSKGLIEEVASGVSRLDYTGGGCPHHLLEPQTTNSFLQSNKFDTTWTTGTTTVTNNQIGVGGSIDAWKLKENGLNGQKFLKQTPNVGGVVTVSLYAKADTRDFVYLRGVTGGVNKRTWFDLRNGVVGVNQFTSAEMISMGDGWYRCVATLNHQAAFEYYIGISKEDGVETYQGNGVGSIYIQNSQLELGSYASSYIPTNGSTVTRLAETADNAGNAATFNDSEGVLFAEISALANGSFRYITLSDGTDSNNVQFGFFPLPKQVQFEVSSGGSSQLSYLDTNIDVLFNTKLCIKYKQNDFSIYVNGFEVHTDSSGLSPIGLDRINFDRGDGCGDNFYGKTKKLEYYNTALTSLEMETLTSYTSFNEMALNFNYTI